MPPETNVHPRNVERLRSSVTGARRMFHLGKVWHHAAAMNARKKPRKPKKTAAKKTAAKKTAAKKTAAKKTAAKKTAAKPAPRADFGAPIDGFFAKQPAELRAILEELRKLVEEAAPDAESSLKWGMPFYTLDGTMMCALGGHRSHVNLILSGPPSAYADPDGRLTGESKIGRHLKLTSLDELPRKAVRTWLRTAAELARKKK
jgi:hypothetical protein